MEFDIKKILEIMPHRYPMLLVDRIVKLEDDEVIGEKCVSINEPFFQGHFPGHPIMPGVLIIEAMGQVGGFLLLKRVKDKSDKVVYFLKIDKVKFRKPVVPGDVLRSELKLLKYKGGLCVMAAKAYVGDTLVAEGEFTAKVVEK
ncbi:MAG: 3-hydroxyacyl-ACP dehydratase FabZ [bacterium]|nr:3-hydroxyacyl-ACP dehydratase FabZ [bacterium]